MTLRARRNTVIVTIVLNALVCIGGAAILFGLILESPERLTWSGLLAAHPGLGYTLFQSTLGCAALIILFRMFRKSSIPEMFLLMVAIGTIAFENLRVVFILLQEFRQPMIYFELISRLLLFFEIAGISGFFFISLYLLGVQYQKVDTILWIQAVVGLLFAYALPIRTITRPSFSNHLVGGPFLYTALIGGIAVLALINLACAWLQQRSLENWGLYSGGAVLIIGRLLSIVLPHDFRIIGVLFLVLGLVLFSRDQYNRYLWN
ncbi:hypothetical protein [Spirochaeta africana]|uniref:Uncharacterized protein n=1 Tax=Spirochaeta africana (strain ATCC 700263 / DSM 8902 / Z-7692) TaxID=889378 RepID=H9UMS9_SPIAZ|nr:hypothetical protein [Spirochaeta africana]AFG38822.1 hypothetical protein Spiaf_2798 [Spirochaeta africana DSM 8902]